MNWEKYQLSWRSSIGHTYRQLLFDILTTCKFSNVLEIGCLRGFSSTGFIEALNCGCDFKYTICDPAPRMDMKLLDLCEKRENISVILDKSLNVIKPGYDFIFIDGDHSVEYIPFEIVKLLEVDAQTMLAHDTYIENPKYQGPPLYRHVFSKHRKFHYVDNSTFRPEEEKERCGLSFFTKRREIFEKVKPLFDAVD